MCIISNNINDLLYLWFSKQKIKSRCMFLVYSEDMCTFKHMSLLLYLVLTDGWSFVILQIFQNWMFVLII